MKLNLQNANFNIAGFDNELPIQFQIDLDGLKIRRHQGNASTNYFAGTIDSEVFLGTVENDTVLGGPQSDILLGHQGDDYVHAGSGADRLLGNAGADQLVGGDGNDLLLGGRDDDQLFGQSGRDRLWGNSGSDRLDGGTERDRLDGGRGDDVLIDRDGGDRIKGGTGIDEFRIGDGTFGATRIKDFQVGVDRLKFMDLNITFDQLTFRDRRNGIRIIYQDQTLVFLRGITADSLSADDFQFGDPTLVTEVQAALDLATDTKPGATASVITPAGFIWTGAAGVGDLENQVAMDRGDRLDIGSISKPMTAVIIHQLIQEGQLSLDDTLAERLPGIAPRIENSATITLRNLLQHSSGIPEYLTPEYGAAILADPTRQWDPVEKLEFVFDQAAIALPGERPVYSNTNYVLLGLIIEQVTGDTLVSQLHSRIFEPLGMNDSFYPAQEQVPDGFQAGYIYLEDDSTPVSSAFVHPSARGFGDGGVVSTAADLARFTQALTNGELLAPSTFEQMLQENVPLLLNGPNDRYGLGIIQLELGNNVTALGHDGGAIGSTTTAYHFPNQDFTIATIENFNDILSLAEPDANVEEDQILVDTAVALLRGIR